ncbi:MAG TPA: hypothetical protein VFT12_06075 [Thermoanaerobaculia bacterium]|nr:hypothetical protein [Thermoanaerobaculia bacterium]
MRLDRDDMMLFQSACADPGNLHAQELMNVFGVENAERVLENMPTVPLGLFADLVGHVWRAIEEAKRRDQFRARFAVKAASH